MNLIIFLLAAAFIADVYLMFFSIMRKDSSRSVYFVMLAGASALYAAGEMFLQMSSTAGGSLNALSVINMGILLLASCFLLISLSLFQPEYLDKSKSWMLPAAVTYGLLIFFCVVFNENHHLFYRDVEFRAGETFVHIERGVLFWVNQCVIILCMIPSYIILFRHFIKGDGKLRSKMVRIITGSFLPFIANILNLTDILPEKIDIIPLVMPVALILYNADIIKYKLWDSVSVASNTVFETMEDAMIILDNDWCFMSCNNRAKVLFPSLNSMEVFLGAEPITKVRKLPSELENIYTNTPTQPPNEIIFELESPDSSNQISTYRANINKIMDHYGSQIGWYIIIRDITSTTRLINQLENFATTDFLTGISNRRHFLERVGSEMDRSARLNILNALIMYDIDLFKKVNDTHGHAAGDYILCAVVETIQKQLRSYDIIARYGGEEFVIFTQSSDEASLHKFTSRLRKAVEDAEYMYNGVHIPVTASFGAVQMKAGDTFEDAMLAVDKAMYEAKHTGRNRVVIGNI